MSLGPSLLEVWSSLRKVRSLRFEARSGGTTGWSGSGAGAVVVSEPSADTLVFAESGTWRQGGAARPAIRFTNVFRWSAMGDAVRLEHLRFGPDQPVFLFDLAPCDSGEWREVNPHQCSEDCYTAELAVDSGRFSITWKIHGPQKCETIAYTYW